MADIINQEAVDAIINTDTFLTALKGMSNDLRLRLERILNESFAQGLGVKQIVSNIRKVMDINFHEAQRVVRTESHRLTEIAHNQEFLDAQNQGIDTKMKYLATLDNRTRSQSAKMDNQISDNEGKFIFPNGTRAIIGNSGIPAYDINDRCRSIQIIDGISPEIRRSREDGIIPFQSYEEWSKAKGLNKNVYGAILFP